MENTLPLKKEFANWLINEEDYSADSANSYCSYVTSALKVINSINIDGKKSSIFSTIKTLIDKGQLKAFIILMDDIHHMYHDDKFRKSIGYAPNTIYHWISGINKYKEFIITEFITQDISEELDQTEPYIEDYNIEYKTKDGKIIIPQIEEVEIYTKDELIKNFIFRFITQDRYYDDIYYPIGLVKRIFYKANRKKDFNKKIDKLINNILIHTESGVLKFRNIDNLKINKTTKEVIVSTNDGEFNVCTPIHMSENKPLKVVKLREISLDHLESMHDLMKSNLSKLPEFSILTTKVKDKVRGNISYKKMKKSYTPIMNDNVIDKIDVSQLEKELDLLFNGMEIQLMDRRENTRKGKN